MDNEKKHKIYCYGTLRPGTGETVQIPGRMFDLGWFPGAVLIGVEPEHHILAEVIEVDDAGLARLDRYEGYDPRHPEHSLYVRKEYEDGFIYQFNGNVDGKLPVLTGDWLDYIGQKEGCNASHFARR